MITTDLGGMYCFGIDSGEEPDVLAPARAAREPEARGDEVGKLLASLESPRGYALIVGDENPVQLARGLVHQSALHVVIAASGATAVAEVRSALTPLGQYGDRIAVVEAAGDRLPFADYLFNLVVAGSGAGVSRAEIERVCVPGRGRIAENGRVRNRPALPGAGSWTHQFGNLGNSANSGDRYTTGRVELQWFGGPGPDRMIDRHMRGPPPLAADGLLFIVGENRLIGVDSYNGTELWDVELPDSQRYAMPYDAGYIAAGGGQVFAAVDAELWRIDAATGEVRSRFSLPAEIGRGRHAGYVGVDGDEVYISATLPTAHRTEPGRELADTSYKSVRPVVTARAFARLDARTGRAEWTRDSGAIVQPTITVTPEAVCFVESRGEAVRRHETGRIDLPTLLTSDAWLVALSRESGETIWELPLELPGARNILYLQHDGGRLVLTASEDSAEGDAYYHIRVLDALDGSEFWRSEHGNLKPGELYHGEQVHHPVILGDLLVAEPYVYNLESGARVNPDGGDSAWTIRRPGHSCGTMSGSAECLFFRANNPTVLDLGAGVTGSDRFRTLAPSRVGCWINILPVDGLVLVPESSASCVCHYSLQTSMGFRPAR